MSSNGNQEFLSEFVAESRDHLESAEACLMRLTREAGDTDAVKACFRAIHTIKGGASFMGLDRIQSLAHIMEQTLDAIRQGKATADHTVCDVLLASITRLRELLEAIGSDAFGAGDDADLKTRLQALRPPQPPTRDELISQLIALEPSDRAGIAACLDRFAIITATQPAAAAILARMRGAASHADLMSEAEALAEALATPATTAAVGTTLPSGGIVGDAPSVANFSAEAEELLGKAEAVLLASANPDRTQIEDLFRSFHTVKGMAAYLAHPRIEQLAHVLESRLTAARDGIEVITPDLHALALAGIDGLRALICDLRTHGSDRGPWPASAAACATRLGIAFASAQVAADPEADLPPEVPRLGDMLVATGQISRENLESDAAKLKPGERLGDKLVESGKISRAAVEQAAKQQEEAAKAQGNGFARVSIARLDELVNLAGELLVTQSQVAHDGDVVHSHRLSILVGRQSRVVRSLQSLALGLRLVPLRATFQKISRVVHDTARRVNKQIELELSGEDTEVDRTLVEAIADPLLHMVRNAVDHGIESGEARVKAGKTAAGHVRLSAAQTGDQVIIAMADDGRGLDPDRLTAKAKEMGLIPADAVLSKQEAWNLIFAAGFSTAEQVTGISGRGVGMDVVKRNLERIHGRVDIDSTVGAGTTFTIRLPLTTAILDAMTLRVGTETFLVPITSVVETLRPAASQVQEVLGKGKVIQARGHLVPVMALGEMFGIAGAQHDPTRATLVVLEREGGPAAVLVDELLGLQQVVIKLLEADSPHHPGIAGAAILGDGRVGLILDPKHLITTP